MKCCLCKATLDLSLSKRYDCVPVCQQCRATVTAWRYKYMSIYSICPYCKQKKDDNDTEYTICFKCRSKVSNKYRSVKQRVVDKLGGKCHMCDTSFKDLQVYDIHHLHGKDRPLRMSDPWSKIEKEIENCVLLCANCHRIVHTKNF